jgi:hypothetical protein
MAVSFPASRCTRCPLHRRDFLRQAGAAAAGALGALAAPRWLQAAEPLGKTRIRILYALHAAVQPVPDWPHKGFDFRPVTKRIEAALRRQCAGFEFLPSLASGPEQAKNILAEDQAQGGIDGYLVYQMNGWNQVVQTMAASGKPVLYADFLFGGSGGFLAYNASFLRNQIPNVGFVASSNTRDLVEAVKCFQVVKRGGSPAEFVAATAQLRRQATPSPDNLAGKKDEVRCLSAEECIKRLRSAKILAVHDKTTGAIPAAAGITFQHISFAELDDAWAKADKDALRAVASGWRKAAQRIEGVDDATLAGSAAMYVGMKQLLGKYRANGITVDCLAGFYGKHIHAYPCLAYHELCNEGLIGGCECDVRSAATMLIGTTLTQGRPGYISDPVIDTAKRRIIYAHCVASNRVFGPQGQTNPFQILTHSEDRQGASVRSFLPTGYLTTTVEFDPLWKQILFHQGKAVANDPDERGCRTKLCVEPLGDIEKVFKEWDKWGWHRVTFYGDLRQPILALADGLGWKIVEEA